MWQEGDSNEGCLIPKPCLFLCKTMKQGNYNLGNYRGYVQTRLQGVLSPLQALTTNVQGVRVLLGPRGEYKSAASSS